MNSARCPICHDIISLGVSIKLNQTLICPTCLGRLQAVSLNPFELEPLERQITTNARPSNHGGNKKSISKIQSISDDLDDDLDDLDDYTLERRLRHKSDRYRHQKSADQHGKPIR